MKSVFLYSGGRRGRRNKDSEMETNVLNSDRSVNVSFPSVIEAYGSTSPTSLVDKIHDFESQMLEGKHVLVGDDGKPLKPSHEASNIADVGCTSNDANKGRKVYDSGEKTNGNSLSSFVVMCLMLIETKLKAFVLLL